MKKYKERGTSSSNLDRRSSHHSSLNCNTVAIAALVVVAVIAWNTGRTDLDQLRKQIEANRAGISIAQYESDNATEERAILNDRISAVEAKQAEALSVKAQAVTTTAAVVTKPVVKSNTRTLKVTFYCSCAKCCGKTNGITASGAKVKAGRTCALNGVKFGTKVSIPGVGSRIVEDRVGKDGVIDVYVDSHAEALKLGTFNAKVTVGK